jgi:branched-chain amino acid transport system substrate-binding protein
VRDVRRVGRARMGHLRALFVAMSAIVLPSFVLVACSSTHAGSAIGASSGTGSGPGVTANTLTVGVIESETGSQAAPSLDRASGFKAEIDTLNAAGGIGGRHIEIVTEDDQSSLAGNLAAAKSLVEAHQVFAVVELSATASESYAYLNSAGIPTIRTSSDVAAGVSTIFDTSGVISSNSSSFLRTFGNIMKSLGAHHVASMSSSINLAGVIAAKTSVESAQYVGLSGGYLNVALPPTVTDWTPYILAMKSANVDGFIGQLPLAETFAILTTAKQQGLSLKVLIANGYDNSVLMPADKDIAQGAVVLSRFAPVELHTAATERELAVFQKYGVPPGYENENGYVAGLLLREGLVLAGSSLNRQTFIDRLKQTTDFTADGLAARPLQFAISTDSPQATKTGFGPGNCVWMLKVQGSKFVPVSQAPVCGSVVNG